MMSTPLVLHFSDEIARGIRDWGARDYPNETCGALLGVDGDRREVRALFPLTNRRDDSPRNRFAVTAQDFKDAERAASEQGLELIGWYHSHPDHPARPSEFDREHAWPWFSYIIVSVHAGKPLDMTSWRLADDRTHYLPEEIPAALAAAPAK
jgi:proteasome lid subunit RPN8/RPN11